MMQKILRVFLDTSVIFAAVLSPSGGARKLFQLGEVRMLNLLVSKNVLRECDDVVRRKAPASLPALAQLLELGGVEISPAPTRKMITLARSIVTYEPDAYVLADAIGAEPDWFITHDSQHFLKGVYFSNLAFHIGTPGDLIQQIRDKFTNDV